MSLELIQQQVRQGIVELRLTFPSPYTSVNHYDHCLWKMGQGSSLISIIYSFVAVPCKICGQLSWKNPLLSYISYTFLCKSI
jgi:hypothetical protein